MELAPDRMQRAVVLTTSRLVLTSWLLDDVESLREVHSDPETMRFVRNGRPESRDEVRRLVGGYIAEDAARGWTTWRLADLDGDLVGRSGFGGTPERRELKFVIRRYQAVTQAVVSFRPRFSRPCGRPGPARRRKAPPSAVSGGATAGDQG